MKRILTLCAMLLMLVAGASCKKNNKSMNNQIDKQEKILFINGSPNREGNTAALAKGCLKARSMRHLTSPTTASTYMVRLWTATSLTRCTRK